MEPDGDGRTVAEELRRISMSLKDKYGAGEAKALGRVIFENLKGWSPVDIAIKANEPLSGYIEGKIAGVVERLLHDEPVQYIFGVADFYGMKLKVTRDTLIPRPETAELVDLIVEDNRRKDLKVLDIGTGSGCIAIALSRNLPFAEVTAIDISAAALDVARENASVLHAGVSFVQADILNMDAGCNPVDDAVENGVFDIIVSNPPYIAQSEKSDMDRNVTAFEPAGALFVPDNDPLVFYRAILGYAERHLDIGGRVYFEINPLFAGELKTLCMESGFDEVNIIRDSYGKLRFIQAGRIIRK